MKNYIACGVAGLVMGFLVSWFVMTVWDGLIPAPPENVIIRQALMSHCQDTPVRVLSCPGRVDTCVCGNLTEKDLKGGK
tara:strand:+ start:3633 stop:3869 length:237 start_codon:yes stop_codon:yes gene_type:complete